MSKRVQEFKKELRILFEKYQLIIEGNYEETFITDISKPQIHGASTPETVTKYFIGEEKIKDLE